MKKKWLFWLPVGAAAIWAGSHLLPGIGHFGHFGGHGMMQGGSGQGMMQSGQGPGIVQDGAGQGMMQGGRGHRMMGHGGMHEHGFDFGWTRILVGVGITLFGISLRKHAGDKVWKKWAGYGLIGLGLAATLKAALPVLAIGAGAYWLFKKAGSSKQKGYSPIGYTAAPASSNSQILDAWEKNITKEEK
ncbi:hypothetical protein PH210_22200 [Paenibacillus sp. BSR1-1]|uniref:hypothetical protein n=1 Tax=Paenibacillus sp. BSR1-1 TaxID=3020845 RepID=UPI0025AFF5B6|nr:hypothetical protein [Paenibacillus sp. BSR1-1]MDN3018888.1 hypothetical protein [Paenibacillus sp. BSR1-1]